MSLKMESKIGQCSVRSTGTEFCQMSKGGEEGSGEGESKKDGIAYLLEEVGAQRIVVLCRRRKRKGKW